MLGNPEKQAILEVVKRYTVIIEPEGKTLVQLTPEELTERIFAELQICEYQMTTLLLSELLKYNLAE